MFRIADEPVLQHLGIARKRVLHVEGLQETCADNDSMGLTEYTHLVFQSSEVNSSFAANRGIDHRQQCCWNVDEGDSPFERAGSEASKVGNHSATQANHQRMACGSTLLQLLPHKAETCQVFVLIACRNGNGLCRSQTGIVLDHRPAKLLCVDIGENKEPVGVAFGDGRLKCKF